MQMVTPMKENLSMTKLMVSVSTYTTNKCKNIKVNGRMICNMAMVVKSCATILFMKAISCKERNMVRVNMYGLIPVYTKVNGLTMK